MAFTSSSMSMYKIPIFIYTHIKSIRITTVFYLRL